MSRRASGPSRRGVAVRVEHPAAAGEPAWLAGDAGRIGQAMLNLAHNAVKYSNPGGEVRLGWEERANRLRLFVADDGIGIARAHQGRIFERFYKVDRARTAERPDDPAHPIGGSAGLGLAIVRHIAEAHHGSVGFVSAEGVGSTFWIELPRAQDGAPTSVQPDGGGTST
ncbi:MAG TPA: HAMP domain-containing sensor histidine kinase [Candidatus Limnocylindria bacterium]|nr:HAMP domain-containing sensor histidine kinase [Candidatus Limnocylindria bacterium]